MVERSKFLTCKKEVETKKSLVKAEKKQTVTLVVVMYVLEMLLIVDGLEKSVNC